MAHPTNRVYLQVFLALIVLTVVTVAVSYVHLGHSGNVIVGLLIAAVKAGLVAFFFMHLKYEGTLIKRVTLVPLLLLGILVLGLILDVVVFLPKHEILP